MTESLEPARPGLAGRLGWRVERRPRPGFAHVLGAAAGAFLVVGVVAFVVEATDDDPTIPGVLFTLALIAGALLLGARAPGPLRSACVTALVLAVPLLWFFGFFGGGNAGRGEIRGVYLLSLAGYLLLYLLSWTKGRAIFLAGALLAFASWATFEVADSSSNVVPFQSELSTSSGSTNFGFSQQQTLATQDDTTDSTATVAMLIGLVFLAVGAALDRQRYEGAATPFIAIGAIETLVGAIVLGGNDSVFLGGLLAVCAGAVVGLVGGRGDRRRATTWIGVLAVFGGCVAILADIAPDSAAGVGLIALGFAVVLGALAYLLAPVLGEPDDGYEPLPPPTVPPGGDSATATLPDAAAA
ncbi:MAG TPA: hypothetical protein VIA11_03965 [Acidimicrobiia bacterium]|nr:hypothetical protein [Acidimicrobiia bacterium]